MISHIRSLDRAPSGPAKARMLSFRRIPGVRGTIEPAAPKPWSYIDEPGGVSYKPRQLRQPRKIYVNQQRAAETHPRETNLSAEQVGP
jgi:hypothetical protein